MNNELYECMLQINKESIEQNKHFLTDNSYGRTFYSLELSSFNLVIASNLRF